MMVMIIFTDTQNIKSHLVVDYLIASVPATKNPTPIAASANRAPLLCPFSGLGTCTSVFTASLIAACIDNNEQTSTLIPLNHSWSCLQAIESNKQPINVIIIPFIHVTL